MNRTNRVQCYMYVRDLFGYGYIFWYVPGFTELQNYTLTKRLTYIYLKSIQGHFNCTVYNIDVGNILLLNKPSEIGTIKIY